jgi:hypothetical protein
MRLKNWQYFVYKSRMSSNIVYPVTKLRMQNFRAEYVEAYKQKIVNDITNQFRDTIVAKCGNSAIRMNTLNMTETDTSCFLDLRPLRAMIQSYDTVTAAPTNDQLNAYLTPILAAVQALFPEATVTKNDALTNVTVDWT